MILLRQYRVASFLLVLLAIAAFAIAELDFTTLFLGVALAMLSWYTTEGPRGRSLATWVSNALTIALVGYCGIDFAMRGTIEDAMGSLGRFLLWLLVIKIFSRRSENDDRQRFTLATMLVLTGCLESVDLSFGAIVLVFAGLAAWTAMLWRLAHGAESARSVRAAQNGFAPPLEITFGRRALPQFRWMAVVSLVMIFACSVIGFFLFPRFAEVRVGEVGRGSVTGFNDEIDLRGGDRITESRRELFTLQWIDGTGEAVQASRSLLLRGAVLDSYDIAGQRWYARRGGQPLGTLRTMTDGRLTDLTRGVAKDARARFLARFEMRSLSSDVLFSVYAPVGIATSESRTVSIDPSTLLLRDVSEDRGVGLWYYELLTQPQPDAVTMEAISSGARVRPASERVSFPVAELEPIARQILEEVSRTANIPPEPSADADLAERWTRNREVARAIASWMKSNFTYTTDLSGFGRIPGEDPIVSFLTRYRSGHCEYFASALCAVLRSLAIESRIVTGFIALEYDDRGQFYIVRESNAHAWVEVRTGEFGWTAVDATPEDSLYAIQERNRSFADQFRWIYSRLEFLWNSGVVSYDASSQQNIAERVQSGWREAMSSRMDAVASRMRAVAMSLSLGRAGDVWFAVIGVGICTAGLAWLIVVVRRRRLRAALQIGQLSPREQARLQRDAAFYIEALRALAAAGAEKPAHMSARAFGEALLRRNAAVGAAFQPIAEDFYKVRYGGIGVGKVEANSHVSHVLALRKALRHNSGKLRVD